MAEPPKIIYIVDDDTALRTAYAAALHKLGYEVKTAADGIEGQALLKEGRPHLIILDMLMPNLDGMGFLRQLRADSHTADVPVVVTSNFESMPDAEGLNISKYLSKMQNPPDAVAAAVDAIVKGSR